MQQEKSDFTPEEHVAIMVLARVAAEAPHALELAAQLFGVAPCRVCGYVKSKCRCPKKCLKEM